MKNKIVIVVAVLAAAATLASFGDPALCGLQVMVEDADHAFITYPGGYTQSLTNGGFYDIAVSNRVTITCTSCVHTNDIWHPTIHFYALHNFVNEGGDVWRITDEDHCYVNPGCDTVTAYGAIHCYDENTTVTCYSENGCPCLVPQNDCQ